MNDTRWKVQENLERDLENFSNSISHIVSGKARSEARFFKIKLRTPTLTPAFP
jgi:hypothetical protein